MQHQPPRQREGSGQHPAAFSFEAKVENEEELLDAVLASLARGAFPAEGWENLHAAARRDDRANELAFAFETVSQSRRMKTVPPSVATEFLLEAARFFSDVFGDDLGAASCLERALAIAPSNMAALGKVETLLLKAGQPKKLAEILASVAQRRERGDQAPLLRRAIELVSAHDGTEDMRVIDLLQQLLRAEPGDEDARARLEALYVKGSRFRDVLRLNEQALAADPPPPEASRRRILARIIELYAEKLHEPERAMPHVEQLLAAEPANEAARRAAQKLVVIKGLAGRAAAALAAACESFGTPQEVARYLTIEIESTRGPKRAELLARIGRLKHDRMGDEKGAFEAFEQALAIDASDDALRSHYIELAAKLKRYADAAKTLSRVLSVAKEPAIKAKTGAQLGQMLLYSGDPKRAKSTLAAVLAVPEAPDDAVLVAARTLWEILEKEKDPRALADVLERVGTLEPDPEKRREADERLSELATQLKDKPRAIAAYERLLSTSARAKALAALAPLYEASGAPDKLARLLEERAKDSDDPAAARGMMMRAVQVRSEARDVAGAIATCSAVIERFGPARDVLAILVPVLEEEGRWPELATALEQDAELTTTGPDRAALLARAGSIRMERLGDAGGAIAAFDEALAFDPGQADARSALEKLAAAGDNRLDAVRVLEPVYRREGGTDALLRMLGARGVLAPDVDERLGALRDAADLAAATGSPAAGAVDLVSRGLAEAAGGGRPIAEWLDRLDRLLPPGREAKRRATILSRAIAEHEVTSADLSQLAQQAAEAQRAAGRAGGAIALYRRALSFEPRSAALLSRIAAIEWKELRDAEAAMATYRTVLEIDDADAGAQAALEELYAEARRWGDLAALLEGRLARVAGGEARAVRAKLAQLAAENGDAERAREQCARLLEDPGLAPDDLDALDRAAGRLGDAEIARGVLARRAELATDPRERVALLEALGQLDEDRRGDLEAAAAAWKRGAILADEAGDDETARRLYWRARKVAPEDHEVTARLVGVCERAGSWSDLPRLYAALADEATDEGERVRLTLRTAEVIAGKLGDPQGAARAIDAVLARMEEREAGGAGAVDASQRAELLLARAGAVAVDPASMNDAARTYREILGDDRLAPAHPAAAAALEALVDRDADSPRRRDDRRWLLEWRAEHAPQDERAGRLLAWARDEETTFADPARALALHRRVLGIDPDRDESLSAIARLALGTGETEEAIAALRTRRDRAEGAARTAIELQIARLLLARTPGSSEAIEILERACEEAGDPDEKARILGRLLDAPAGDAAARRGWFERLAALERDRGNLDAALAIAIRAAREMPGVPELWDRAEELTRARGRPEDVAALYDEVFVSDLGKEAASSLGERAVQFFEEWFEDPGRVVKILERVLDLDPAADWAFDRLKLVLDSAERWDELFALYDRALEAAAGAKRITLLEDAAQTAKDFADRPERAILYIEQLYALRPSDAKLAGALERLYERQGRHRELVSLLSARLPSLKRDEEGRTRLRVAALWLDDLGDVASALDVVEPMLQGAATKGVAPEVWAVLERALAASPFTPEPRSSTMPPPPGEDIAPRSKRGRKSEGPAPPRGPARKRAAAWLRDHYTATGRDADLARMLLVLLEGVRSHKERVRVHLQVAELYERVGALADALEQTGFVLILTPDDAAQRAKLVDLAERTGNFERLASILAEAAEEAEGQALRSALTMQAADVRSERLGDAAGAIALLSQVLAARKVPEADVLAASRRLESLLAATGRAEERLDVAERIASVEPDEGERRLAIGRAARLATELGQDARGIALWERRLAWDSRDTEALDGLVELLERTGQSARLADVLELRAVSTKDGERRRSDRVRVARLLGEVLDRPKDAITAWRRIEEEFGEAEDVALAMTVLYRTTQRWKELAALLARQAERAADAGVRAELLRQLGDVQRLELDAKEKSTRTYAQALEVDPRNAGARAGLQALADDDLHRAAAVDVLLGALRACDDWRAILELSSHRLLAAPTESEKLAVLLESAQIAEERAGDAAAAFEALRRAFAIAPGNGRVEGEFARLADAAGASRSLADAYREAIDGSAREDGALVADLWKKIGAVLETRLGDPRGALEAYLQVVAKAADADAACAAVRVAAGLGEWDVAARALVDVAASTGSAPEQVLSAFEGAAQGSAAWDAATAALAAAVSGGRLEGTPARDIHARLADWHRERRNDADSAEEALRRALDHDRSNAALLGALAQLQRRRPGRALVDTLLQLSGATGGDLGFSREAAEVAIGIAEPELARSILRDGLDLARGRWVGDAATPGAGDEGAAAAAAFAEWAVEGLARLHEEGGDPKAVADVLVAGSELPFEPATRRAMRRRAARIALDRLSDHDRAVSLYLSLFDDDPHDAEAIDRLVSTYAAQGRARDLLRLRERQIAAAEQPGERLGLRLDAAKLHGELGDGAAATAALRANLEEDARHEESVEALAAMLDAEGKSRELGELLAAQAQMAESAGDGARAAALWFRSAGVAEGRLSDPAAAEAYHARAVALEPRASSFDALARLAQARGDPAAAAARLESLLDVVEPEKRSDAILRLAEALVAAGQPARAAERLEASLGAGADVQPLRLRLVELYRAEGQWAKLAHLVSDAATHASDPAARLPRLLEAAKLFMERCAEPEHAVPLLEQACSIAPGDQAVRLTLAEALSQARRFDDARAILKEMIAAFGGRRPKERAPVHYQMARLEIATGHRAAALAELDTATRIDPQNPETLRTLAELARDDGQLERAEKSYRALLVVLRRRADARESASIARSEVLLELSAIAARDGETDRAREILESAIEAAATDEFEQERLETELRKRGDDGTLVRVLEAKLAHIGDSPAAAKTLGELAHVLEGRLGRPERALDALLRAVALDPQRAATHEAALSLARSLGKVGRYVDGAVAAVDAAQEAGDTQLACGIVARLGGVVEAELGDARRAAELYERAVALGSRSGEILRSLDRLYEGLGDPARQAAVLALRVDVEALEGGPRAASDAVYRLAALRLGSRETLDAGVEAIERALGLDPQPDRAADLLRLALSIDPTHGKALDLYERVGRQPGQERTLVDALRLRGNLPGSGVETVREGVEVATRIGDGALAEELLRRFVEARRAAGPEIADLPWALGTLADLREAAGDLRGAVELKREAAEIAEPDAARALKFEAARIAADKLEDLALAAEAYEALRRDDPADREAWEPLLGVYRKSGDRRRLVALLDAVVDYVDDASERARLRFERVRTMLEGKDLDDAEAAPLLREIVDEDGSQVDAALMLATILERTGDREGLVDLLGRQIDAAKDRGDPAAVASLALRLGALLEESDRVVARNVYYTGLDWEPQNWLLLDALLRMLEGPEDAAERADVVERRLATEASPAAEEMALALHAARIELGDEAAAERALEVGFRAFPASALLRGRLEDAYRERSDRRKLAELIVLDAGARVDPGERLSRLKEAAAIWRGELNDPGAAAAALGLAREVTPGDAPLLREHVDALVEAGERATALAELGAFLDSLESGDAGRARVLAMRAAVRAAGQDAEGALADLEGAFEIDRAAYAADLAAALSAARDSAAPEPGRLHVLRLRQAQVLPYAGDFEGARAILGELVRHDPKDREALRTLASLEAALERWDASIAALGRLVALEEGQAAVDASLSLAEACDRAGRLGDARAALERARTFAPDDGALRERLERAYEQLGAWHELATLALEQAGATADPRARFALLLRAGRVLLEQAGDPEAAIGALEQARVLLPADLDCVGLLSDAYTLWGRAGDALAMIEEVISPHKGRRSRELAPIYWRLSRVHQHMEDAAAELRTLVLALECDAQNGEVCAAVGTRAMELDQLDLATRALRAVTLLKVPGPMSKALAYQYMGEIAFKQGDPRRAFPLLKRALAEDPSLDAARELIAAIERGG